MERLEAMQTRRTQSDLVGSAIIIVGVLHAISTAIAFTPKISLWFIALNGFVAGALIVVGIKFMQGTGKGKANWVEVKKKTEVKE